MLSAKRAASCAEGLRTYLATAEHFRGRSAAQAELSGSPLRERLESMLSDIRVPLAKVRSAGTLLNPWAMAGLKRDEVRNAAVLAQLWSPAIAGEAAIDFLDAFLSSVRPAGGFVMPSFNELRRGYRVVAEDCPLGMISERVDLTIEGTSFLIGIEIKIDAAFQHEQLARYVAIMTKRAFHSGNDRRSHVVLLAPRASHQAEVTSASWRHVEGAAVASIPRKTRDRTLIHHLIDSFGAHVSTLFPGD